MRGSTHPFSGDVRDGRLYGRGACDMKAGLVAAHWAVQAIRASGVQLRGDLLLASVQGEEDGGLGTFALLQRGWRADACVIPEPTTLDIIPANSGALTFRIRIRGQATHAARRTDGVSAIEKFWPVFQALQRPGGERHDVIDPLAARWPLAHPLSIGIVHAGDWASSVPDLLVAEGRLGVAIGEPVEHARADLERAVAEACADDAWLREHPAEVEWWGGQFASGRIPADSDLVQRVARRPRCGQRRPTARGVRRALRQRPSPAHRARRHPHAAVRTGRCHARPRSGGVCARRRDRRHRTHPRARSRSTCAALPETFRVSDHGQFAMERVTGIEPAFSAWEADVLPLNYTRRIVLQVTAAPHRLPLGDNCCHARVSSSPQ